MMLILILIGYFWTTKYLNEVDKVVKLKQAIRKHRDATGHDRCWQNDIELYEVLGESIPNQMWPPKEEFEQKCKQYTEEHYNETIPTNAGSQSRPME